MKLSDLFPSLEAYWPWHRFQTIKTFSTDPESAFAIWFNHLDQWIDVTSVQTGAATDSVAAMAEFDVVSPASNPKPLEFSLESTPSVTFRLVETKGAKTPPRVFASVTDTGGDLVIESLPVEMRLTTGLVQPAGNGPKAPTEVTTGTFKAGKAGTQKIVYRRSQPTSIFTHVRIVVDSDCNISIEPDLPITFSNCRFSGVNCDAVHGFELIPSAEGARDRVPWLRHDIGKLNKNSAIPDGMFAFRSLSLHPDHWPAKQATAWLKKKGVINDSAELVINDLVAPFHSDLAFPYPRHLTTGIRRSVDTPGDLKEMLSFQEAPVTVQLLKAPSLWLAVNKLFYRSFSLDEETPPTPITFDISVYRDKGKQTEQAFGVSLEDEYTLLLTWRRGMTAPSVLDKVLDWKFFGTTISITALRAGVSIQRLADGSDFEDAMVIVADLLVRAKPADTKKDWVRVEGLDGKDINVLIEKVGWWFEPSFEKVSAPDGFQVIFGRSIELRIIMNELGLLGHDNGGTYIVFSGGLGLEIPAKFEGSFTFKRMRVRVGGNEDAPGFGIDGFYLTLKGGPLKIEAGGHHTERRVGADLVSEIGLSGLFLLDLKADRLGFAVDLLKGNVSGPQGDFDYFMVQVAMAAGFPIGYVRVAGMRFLMADNMQPSLWTADKESRDLRYYNWSKRTNLLAPAARRLSAWKPVDDSWSVGAGASVGFTGLNEVVLISAFVFVTSGPEENGFLISGELFLLSSDSPVAYIVIEYDDAIDRFSLLAGVDLTIKKFWKNAPSILADLVRITGSLLIKTNPTVVAIGRLKQEDTWLRARFDIDLWLAKSYFEFAFCFERAPEEATGTAASFRFTGASWIGPGRASFNMGIGWFVAGFSTGSIGYAVVVWAEGGLEFLLFGFLNFGLHARAECNVVGPEPDYGTFSLEVRIETPWFLPDVTFRVDWTSGALEPETIETCVSPVRTAGAKSDTTEETGSLVAFPAGLVADTDAEPNARPKSLSLADIRKIVVPDRDARHKAFVAKNPTRIRTDSAVTVAFSVPVDDVTGFGTTGTKLSASLQKNEDLDLEFRLTDVIIRRKARFETNAAWKTFLEKKEIKGTVKPGGGMALSGGFTPDPVNAVWDFNPVGKSSVAQQLTINASTPFTFQIAAPEQDEIMLEQNPDWPCCPKSGLGLDVEYTLTFENETLGDPIAAPLFFPETTSTFVVLSAARIGRSHFAGTALPASTQVCRQEARRLGALFRIVLDEPAAWVDLHPAWPAQYSIGQLTLVADGAEGQVAEVHLPLDKSKVPGAVRLMGKGAITSVAGYVTLQPGQTLPAPAASGESGPTDQLPFDLEPAIVELDRLVYTPWDATVRSELQKALCGKIPESAFAGKGKISFLPNHDYEIELKTEMRLKHTAAGSNSAKLSQFLYFRTKGLPGLNATPRIGAEIEPYVTTQYPAATLPMAERLVYREEPVALAFNEHFNIIVPTALRPAGPASAEKDVLMELTLTARPEVAVDAQTTVTTASKDWIDANMRAPSVAVADVTQKAAWQTVLSAADQVDRIDLSQDPRRQRLAALLARPGTSCVLPDPLLVQSGVLVHPPIGGGQTASGKPLWPKNRRMRATVAVKGAPSIHRERFDAADLTAFDLRSETGPAGRIGWEASEDGAFSHKGTGSGLARFGNGDWLHFLLQTAVRPIGKAAGIGLALPANGGLAPTGLFALLENRAGSMVLTLRRRGATGGALGAALAEAVLPKAADATAPIPITLTAFDDVVRVEAMGKTVEATREYDREGYLALVCNGQADFTSLTVGSLPLYEMAFATSRFEGFADHIGSFGGTCPTLSPAAFGVTPSSTVAGLFTAAQVAEAMKPEQDASVRQALFGKWAAALGVPLRESVERFEISSYSAGGQKTALFIESPEPIRFSSEVKLTARVSEWRRVDTVTGRYPRIPNLGEADFDAGRFEVDLDRGELPDAIRTSENLAIVRSEKSVDGSPLLRVFSGEMRTGPRGSMRLIASETGKVSEAPLLSTDAMRTAAEAPIGSIFVLGPDLAEFLAEAVPAWKIVEREQEFSILSDGSERRALLIPLAQNSPMNLSSGTYDLTFSIHRKRWTETKKTTNSVYTDTAKLSFRIR